MNYLCLYLATLDQFTMSAARGAAVVAALVLLAVVVAASAVDLCSQSFCACPDAGKRVECRCDVAMKVRSEMKWDQGGAMTEECDRKMENNQK